MSSVGMVWLFEMEPYRMKWFWYVFQRDKRTEVFRFLIFVLVLCILWYILLYESHFFELESEFLLQNADSIQFFIIHRFSSVTSKWFYKYSIWFLSLVFIKIRYRADIAADAMLPGCLWIEYEFVCATIQCIW